MIDLQPITTGDLISIAQFAIGIAQSALIWYGLYTMRAGTRQRDKALDEIIAQGQEGREALQKTMQSLDKTMATLDKTLEGFDKTLEGLDKTNEGLKKSNEALGKSTEALAVLLKRSA
ncbi:MAG: hypothetical protein F4X91_10040 [Nitrospinae bacterium]|nr:hypothetical protein [Nitrospinota bacterium]